MRAAMFAVLVGGLTAQVARAQSTTDTLRRVDTVENVRDTYGVDGPFHRPRASDELWRVEVGVFGQAAALAVESRSVASLGGGARAGVFLPYGLELEGDAASGSARAVAPGGRSGRYVPIAARLLSNWDFANFSSMFFGGGVADIATRGDHEVGPSGIVGFRIGEVVGLRTDLILNYSPGRRSTDFVYRLGASVVLGSARRANIGRIQRERTITRTVVITPHESIVAAAPTESMIAVTSAGDVGEPLGRDVDAAVVTVHFAFNAAALDPDARTLLRQARGKLEGGGIGRIVVEGHADQCGSRQTNVARSRDRAEATRAFLVDSLGVDGARIDLRARGADNLVASRAVQILQFHVQEDPRFVACDFVVDY